MAPVLEVEVKVAIDDGDMPGIERALRGLQAIGPVEAIQEDMFFDHPSRDLAAGDEAFRLRREGDTLTLTYKGPREDGDIKSRPEHNLPVTADPLPLLQALGFRPAAQLVKTRRAWHVQGAEITIDDLEGVGAFVEIEAAQGVDEPGMMVESLRERLGLSDRRPVLESYLEMALAARSTAARRL